MDIIGRLIDRLVDKLFSRFLIGEDEFLAARRQVLFARIPCGGSSAGVLAEISEALRVRATIFRKFAFWLALASLVLLPAWLLEGSTEAGALAVLFAAGAPVSYVPVARLHERLAARLEELADRISSGGVDEGRVCGKTVLEALLRRL